MRAPSGRRRRSRDARGGGACERRAAERHDLRECDRRRGAARGDVRGDGDAASYHWELGNGETAEGPTAGATYGPGLWTVTVTATAADGSTSQASVTVRSEAVTLRAGGREPLRETRRLSGAESCRRSPARRWLSTCADAEAAAALADADGAFRLRLPRVRAPGPYEARTRVAASAPVALRVRPLLRATFVGAQTVGGRLGLAARVLPCRGGHALDPPLPRRRAHAQGSRRSRGQARRGHRPHRRLPRGRSRRAREGMARRSAHRARRRPLCAPRAGSRDGYGDGLVFRYYGGAGYQFQPLLSFAALNQLVLEQRCGAARRLASALLARAVRSGDAVYWEYDFPFQGGPVPWRSGFAQAVAAQALARAGVMLRDPALTAAAAASFRGLRRDAADSARGRVRGSASTGSPAR